MRITSTIRYAPGEAVYAKPVQQSPIAAYENSVEVTSLQQLEEIISDPDEMRMQALLVRERILGPAHPDTSYYIRWVSYSTLGIVSMVTVEAGITMSLIFK